MNRQIYPAFLALGEKKKFILTFPDLPNCKAAGKTLDEALFDAKESLESYLYSSLEKGYMIPKPSKIASLNSNKDSVVCLIEAALV